MRDPSPAGRPPIGREDVLKAATALGALSTDRRSGPQMMSLLCNPAVGAREVARLIGGDPAISARVLRVANSPYYGQTRTVSSIDRACVLLGLDGVRGIAAAACLDHTMSRERELLIDQRALLDHCLATAVAADMLARSQRPDLAGEAFIGGLLQNLGVPIQAHIDPDGTRVMLERGRRGPHQAIRSLEARYAAVGHEECAAVVLEAWQLPDSLVCAARHHHEPQSAPPPHRTLAALVHLAAHAALASGYAFGLESVADRADEQALRDLEIDAQGLQTLAAEIGGRVFELRRALGG